MCVRVFIFVGMCKTRFNRNLFYMLN